jgi:predicted ribosome quality control (RQC) complex YloA/Tae2 family protein
MASVVAAGRAAKRTEIWTRMQVDAFTLAAVADELRAGLLGARVDDVIQPTPLAVALQCYGGSTGGGARNRWLLASAEPRLARLHLVERKPRKLTAEPPAFVMLLRKYLEGARLREVRQPRWERLLELGFARGPETSWLVVEVMGALSNLILRDAADLILGALRPVSLEKNHYRALVPHVPYRTPPPQTRTLHGESLPRLAPESLSGGDLRVAAGDLLARASSPPTTGRKRQALTAASVLTGQIAGWGRDLAAEALARAGLALDAAPAPDLDWDAVAAAVRDLAALYDTHAWQPTLVYTADDPRPHDAAAYRPARFPAAELRTAPSVNDALAAYFEDAEWHGAVESAKADLRHLLKTQHDRTRRKAEALTGELAALDEAQRLRLEADTLLAFQADVPPGAASYTLANPFAAGADDPATLTLALDPRLSPVENANRRYARYHKLQRAAQAIPPQIAANDLERTRVEQLQTDLALAETPAEIALVRAEVADAGYLRAARAAAKPAGGTKGGKSGKPAKGGKGGKPSQQRRAPDGGAPLRRTSADGFTVLIGKNSRQNEEVTFAQASAGDLWLHARGVPGAHVIVKAGGRPVPDATLREAAALAAYYSQARGSGSVPVDYTEQRYVRHLKGGGPGLVTYERERTLHAAPADPGAASP